MRKLWKESQAKVKKRRKPGKPGKRDWEKTHLKLRVSITTDTAIKPGTLGRQHGWSFFQPSL